jgi:uncharacterized protein YkwD
MAVGAVAVTSGLLPGGEKFTVGGDRPSGGTQIRTETPPSLQTQGDASARPTEGPGNTGGTGTETGGAPAGTDGKAPEAPPKPSATPSPEREKPSAKPSTAEKPRPEASTPASTTPVKPPARPSTPPPEKPEPTAPRTPEQPSGAEAMEAEVLALVNEERAKVGCAPLRFDPALAKLAGDFSADMAKRGFFSHTDPDGDTPWARAEKAGVKNLGGENIARGQSDAATVMNAWMNSEGHRANILNCDYKTLGVGVQLGDGGPWWTQNFGF